MNLEHGLEDGRCHVKILVVDDSGGMRDHIRRAVEKANARSTLLRRSRKRCGGPQEGPYRETRPCNQRLVHARDERTCPSTRDSSKRFKVPFGIITADTSAEVETQATQAGANFVIRKPFTAAKFDEVLTKL